MLRQHVDAGADVTVGCLTVPRDEASAFGVMDTDKDGRIISFQEKPSDPPGTPEDPNVTLASMGIYVFNWDYLRNLLQDDAHKVQAPGLITFVKKTGCGLCYFG